LLGSEGTCTIGRGATPRIEGKTNWTWKGRQYDRYQREHDVLFTAIRKNQPVNNGKRLADSTLLAIMGRMAAYTGQQVTWEQAFNSRKSLSQSIWTGTAVLR
jgi:myo-inositol 2-dehydrogenase/D-chiro-inositol 1-dehydrogenase